jgi:hypothetical protein
VDDIEADDEAGWELEIGDVLVELEILDVVDELLTSGIAEELELAATGEDLVVVDKEGLDWTDPDGSPDSDDGCAGFEKENRVVEADCLAPPAVALTVEDNSGRVYEESLTVVE